MIQCQNIIFSGHAIQRMFERNIQKNDIRHILETGEIIAEYPDDIPFPSLLVYGTAESKPLHIVAATDKVNKTCYIVTAYVPTMEQWSDDYKTRRP